MKVIDVPAVVATDETLAEVGACLIDSQDERTVDKGNFEIVPWLVSFPHHRPLVARVS